jgi:hypothetical protein
MECPFLCAHTTEACRMSSKKPSEKKENEADPAQRKEEVEHEADQRESEGRTGTSSGRGGGRGMPCKLE